MKSTHLILYTGAVDSAALELASTLHNAGCTVTLAQAGEQMLLDGSSMPETTLLIELQAESWRSVAETARRQGYHWFGWNRADDAALALSAYQAGASAVYPSSMTAGVLLQALTHPTSNNAPSAHPQIGQHYQRGDIILPDSESVIEVIEGILALSVIHYDGAQVLLGLCGPGQLLIAHPHDSCSLQLVAHTEARAAFHSWTQASQSPEFSERLRVRLQHLEAWAAMQARPHLDQRILGLLSLLAEQFGETHAEGTLITVRLTQAQLASAANATRTTITRAIGNLRKRGLLTTVGSGDNERFCLRELERGRHLH